MRISKDIYLSMIDFFRMLEIIDAGVNSSGR